MKLIKPKEEYISKLIPIVDYDDGYFLLKDKTNFDIAEIKCKDLQSLSNSDLEYEVTTFTRFLQMYAGDLKIVAMNFPSNTTEQQGYLKYKIKRTSNEKLKYWLMYELDRLKQIEQERTRREFYMFFYSENKSKYKDNLATIVHLLGNRVGILSEKQKKAVLFKLNNKCVNLDSDLKVKEKVSGKYQKLLSKKYSISDFIERKGFNPYLLSEICPQGGISFTDEKLIKTGDGFEQCIEIYKYKVTLDLFWLCTLMNIDNAVTTIDISTEKTSEVKKNINKGMQEQTSRYVSSNSPSAQIDAKNRYSELEMLYEQVSTMGEIIKKIRSRIFVCERTVCDLEDRTKEILDYIESSGHKGAVFLNENKNSWISVYQAYNVQSKSPYARYGQRIQSYVLAGGIPFNYSSLEDPAGTYYGMTSMTNGGPVLFDLFFNSSKRTSYNSVLIGTTGSGKSTLLKKAVRDRITRGDYVRGFDVANEFTGLVNELGGKIINLDGSGGILNALDVLKTSDDEAISFARHISKMTVIYQFLNPDATQKDKTELMELLRGLYVYKGLIPKEGVNENTRITGLHPKKYPIYSDFVRYMEHVKREITQRATLKEKALADDRAKTIQGIISVFKSLITTYGNLFNGHTSIEDIMSTQLVFFNIHNLSKMADEIFDAQMYQAISLCWDNNVQIGMEMKNRYDADQIEWDNIKRFFIVIDEAHRIVNANKIIAVEQINVILRENRKFFGGIMFASQSYLDFVPKRSNAAGVDALFKLFSLAQYKIIMKQDSAALDGLKSALSEEINDSQLGEITKLARGECFLIIGGYKTIRFLVDCTKLELSLYAGGA